MVSYKLNFESTYREKLAELVNLLNSVVKIGNFVLTENEEGKKIAMLFSIRLFIDNNRSLTWYSERFVQILIKVDLAFK